MTSFNNRQQYNKEIIVHINKLIDEFPDLRFCQILSALNINEIAADMVNSVGDHFIVDNFYEESKVTLNKMKGI